MSYRNTVTRMLVVSVAATGLVLFCSAENFVSDGTWMVNHVEKCENPEQYPFKLNFEKRKMNRTHDGFSVDGEFPEDINNAIGILIEVYVRCDGGYKFSENMTDVSMCSLVNKYAKSDWERLLSAAGVNPPNCPVPKGPFSLNNFVIDYAQLPTQGKVGDYKAFVNMMKGPNKVGCVILYCTFTPLEDEDD